MDECLLNVLWSLTTIIHADAWIIPNLVSESSPLSQFLWPLDIFPFFEHFLFKPQNVLGTPCTSLSQTWNQPSFLEALIPLLGNGIGDQDVSDIYVHCFLSVIALVSFKERSCEIHFVQMSWYLNISNSNPAPQDFSFFHCLPVYPSKPRFPIISTLFTHSLFSTIHIKWVNFNANNKPA